MPVDYYLAAWLPTTLLRQMIFHEIAFKYYFHHDDVIKWKHFPCYWALCGGNPPVIGGFSSQRPATRRFDIFFICAWTKGGANKRDASDLKRHGAHYDVTVMIELEGIKRFPFSCTHSHMTQGLLSGDMAVERIVLFSKLSGRSSLLRRKLIHSICAIF